MLVEMVFHTDDFFSRFCFYVIFICGNVELYVATSEKKYFTENDHGYVYITKHNYVIRRCCLLFETLVEHPTSGVSKNESHWVEQ